MLREIPDLPPAPAGLILREITDDDDGLPQAVVVRGQPVVTPGPVIRPAPPEPVPVAGIILRELEPEELELPLMEGFEGTQLDPTAPRRRAAPPPPPAPTGRRRAGPAFEAFPTEQCPSCSTSLADPLAPFCGACGFRMPRVRKAAAPTAEATKKCRRCGLANAVDRSACTNCGQRLV